MSQSSSRAITIALCFSVAVLEGFDIQAMGVAAPKLAPEFHLGPAQMSWLFAISNIGLVIGASFGGWFADRLGRKPVFIASVIAFGVFTFVTAHAYDFWSFFLARFAVGLGFGAALPNMMAVAAEISVPERRASTAAAMFCGMPLGGGTSALITQMLPAGFDWRILFYIGGALPVILAPALYFLLKETLQRGSQDRGEQVPATEALFGEGRGTPTLLLWAIFLPTLLILYLILNWLPTLVTAKGLARSVAPQASLWFNYASVVGALVFGRIVDRYGARVPLVLAYAALIVSLLALGAATQVQLILALSGAAGFFLMGANYSLYGVAAAYYPTRMRGTGSGASVAVGRVGSVAGPLLAGWLLAGGASAATVVQYMAPFAAVACVAVFVLGRYPAAKEK